MRSLNAPSDRGDRLPAGRQGDHTLQGRDITTAIYITLFEPVIHTEIIRTRLWVG